jgi:hypothetical protein
MNAQLSNKEQLYASSVSVKVARRKSSLMQSRIIGTPYCNYVFIITRFSVRVQT